MEGGREEGREGGREKRELYMKVQGNTHVPIAPYQIQTAEGSTLGARAF